MLIVTYRDLLTGELAVDRHADLRAFDMAENNWSCDCNRSIAFGVPMPNGPSYCMGTSRYVVHAIEGDADGLEGYTVEELIAEANRGYPGQQRA